MASSSPLSSGSAQPTSSSSNERTPNRSKGFRAYTFLLWALAPVAAAVVVYQLDSFDPAPLPTHEFTHHPMVVPNLNPHMLRGAEKLGVGHLQAPEDLAFDSTSGVIYTGCADGWIKRVTVNESAAAVENWVNTGGRPLGLALGREDGVVVADSYKGLLRVTGDGAIELLTKEAEGVEFRLTDGVDVAEDGMIYFTDASHKYSLKEFIWDLLEGRPHGRLLSYDPATKRTKVLLSDLYFPNGVAVSPDQQFVVFCETPMRRCKKYYIQGEKKGSVENFIPNLPGLPDNIRYNGDGQYWIALATEATFWWDLAQKHPPIRKVLAVMERYIGRPNMEKNGGFLAVDTEGKPVAFYYDRGLSLVSSAVKVADHLYGGSVAYPYMIRLNLIQHPAVPSA